MDFVQLWELPHEYVTQAHLRCHFGREILGGAGLSPLGHSKARNIESSMMTKPDGTRLDVTMMLQRAG
eukprot:655531-Pelagomonas_calceolata.AAC.3